MHQEMTSHCKTLPGMSEMLRWYHEVVDLCVYNSEDID